MADELTYKYIRVVASPEQDKYGGKLTWLILNKRRNDLLGRIIWYQPWRQWVAQMAEGAAWSSDCLTDVQDAMAKIGREPSEAPLFQETER